MPENIFRFPSRKRKPNFHYTPLPNVITDWWLSRLTHGEHRVYELVNRMTWGWGKTEDAISIPQFMHGITTRGGKRLNSGTGLSDRGVKNAIAGLEAKGLLRVTRRKGRPAIYSIQTPLPPDAPAEVPVENHEQPRKRTSLVPA